LPICQEIPRQIGL